MANYNYVPSEQVKLQQRMAEELMNTPMRQGLRGGQPTDWGRGLAHMLRQWQGGKQLREAKEQAEFNTDLRQKEVAELIRGTEMQAGMGDRMQQLGSNLPQQGGTGQMPSGDSLASDMGEFQMAVNPKTPEIQDLMLAQKLKQTERDEGRDYDAKLLREKQRNDQLVAAQLQQNELDQIAAKPTNLSPQQQSYDSEGNLISENPNQYSGSGGLGGYQGVEPKAWKLYVKITGKDTVDTPEDSALLYRLANNVKVGDTGPRHEEINLPSFEQYHSGQGQIEQTFSPTERQKFDFGQPTQYTPTGNARRLGVDKALSPEQELDYLAEKVMQEATIKKEADIAKNTANAAIDDLIKVQMPKAKSNVTILRSIGNARKLLDEGIRTGSFANLRQDFGRMINTIGFSYNEDATTNTDTFIAEAGTRVGQVINAFGSGTGLSDEDREYAEKMSAGKIAVTKESLYKILEIHEKAARIEIEQYNKRAGAIKDSPYPLTVELPPMTGGQDIDSLLNLY